jgi:hypothetical protein
MTSRLEQAIACGVLPEEVVFDELMRVEISVIHKKYRAYYVGESMYYGHAWGTETLDETIDDLITMLWKEIRSLDSLTYEKHCLDLVYEPMVRPASLVLEIKELGISIQTELCEGWPEKYEQQLKTLRIQRIKEICANGDRVPLPMPFDSVEY